MATVTLFFKAINKDEHLALSFLPREHGRMPTTAKRLVGWPRKKKASAESPPAPSIDHASENLRLSDDVGQEAKRIRCQFTMKQKMHVVMRANRTCLACFNYTNKCLPNAGALLTYK